MNNFRIGDKVVCVDAKDTWNYLQVNMIYTVKKTSNGLYNDYVYLEEDSKCFSWHIKRFKLWNPCGDILQDILDND